MRTFFDGGNSSGFAAGFAVPISKYITKATYIWIKRCKRLIIWNRGSRDFLVGRLDVRTPMAAPPCPLGFAHRPRQLRLPHSHPNHLCCSDDSPPSLPGRPEDSPPTLPQQHRVACAYSPHIRRHPAPLPRVSGYSLVLPAIMDTSTAALVT
jgi:hypothetical protein